MLVAMNASADKLGIAHIVYPRSCASKLRARLRECQIKSADASSWHRECEARAGFIWGMCEMWGRGWCDQKLVEGQRRCEECQGASKGKATH